MSNGSSSLPAGGYGSFIIPPHDLTPQRDMTKYIQWLRTEFLPLQLATPEDTLKQIVDNAIRYWNTHSAYRLTTMVDRPSGKVIQLHPQFKSVVDVIPCEQAAWVWSDHPMWTILGATLIDNVTGDLIMMSEIFRGYRAYIGTNLAWHWERPQNMTEGGKLLVTNIPKNVSKLAIVGTKRILLDEEIVQEPILDWILRYSKALLKQVEGNTLRKSSIVNIKNDGDQLVAEGKEEAKELQEMLIKEGRWTSFVRKA